MTGPLAALVGLEPLGPDLDAMLLELARAGLSSLATVDRELTAEYLKRLPFVAIRTVSPGSFPPTRHLERRWPAGIDVQSWAEDPLEASRLDRLALALLVRAQRHAIPAAGAFVSRFAVDAPGTEVRTPDQPGRLHRWQASYSIVARPA